MLRCAVLFSRCVLHLCFCVQHGISDERHGEALAEIEVEPTSAFAVALAAGMHGCEELRSEPRGDGTGSSKRARK